MNLEEKARKASDAERIAQLEAELIAEREKTKQAWREHDDNVAVLVTSNETIKQLGAANQQLRTELAAERELRKQVEWERDAGTKAIQKLSEQLDASESRLKTVLEAADESHRTLLAKIKEGK